MKIEVINLKKSYQQIDEKLFILKGINLEITAGQSLAILGQSGSGKSTLLAILAGLDRPTSGQLLFNSQDLFSKTDGEITNFRGKHISVIFQSYHLVPHLTALENVMLPLEILGTMNSEDKSKEILDQVGLYQRLNHFPSQLSGGESQRVAIARALVTEPKLLLADEPSGQLDQETGKKVMDLFFKLINKFNTTTVLVTHDPQLAARCDRKLHLEAGELHT